MEPAAISEPIPGLALWHDHLRAAAALIEQAATPMAGVDALVRAGWRPPLKSDGSLTEIEGSEP